MIYNEQAHCCACPRAKARRGEPVPAPSCPHGLGCRVFVVFDRPQNEWVTFGKIGTTEQWASLNRLLPAVGLDAGECYVTSILRCPMASRNPAEVVGDYKVCQLWLDREMQAHCPLLIVGLGFVVAEKLVGGRDITDTWKFRVGMTRRADLDWPNPLTPRKAKELGVMVEGNQEALWGPIFVSLPSIEEMKKDREKPPFQKLAREGIDKLARIVEWLKSEPVAWSGGGGR